MSRYYQGTAFDVTHMCSDYSCSFEDIKEDLPISNGDIRCENGKILASLKIAYKLAEKLHPELALDILHCFGWEHTKLTHEHEILAAKFEKLQTQYKRSKDHNQKREQVHINLLMRVAKTDVAFKELHKKYTELKTTDTKPSDYDTMEEQLQQTRERIQKETLERQAKRSESTIERPQPEQKLRSTDLEISVNSFLKSGKLEFGPDTYVPKKILVSLFHDYIKLKFKRSFTETELTCVLKRYYQSRYGKRIYPRSKTGVPTRSTYFIGIDIHSTQADTNTITDNFLNSIVTKGKHAYVPSAKLIKELRSFSEKAYDRPIKHKEAQDALNARLKTLNSRLLYPRDGPHKLHTNFYIGCDIVKNKKNPEDRNE